MTNMYNLRLVSPGHFQMAKFDEALNVLAVYDLTSKGTSYSCNCPASARVVKYKPCRHQRMMPFMMGAVNTQRFYIPDSGSWIEPIIEPVPEEAAKAEGQSLHEHLEAVAGLTPEPIMPKPEPKPTVQSSYPIVARRI